MADHSSFMDWSPAKPEPRFDPYQRDYYIPGGWPEDPPPPTTGVFARPRPDGLFPKAKRVCFGLATGSKIIASVVAVPLYCIVRRVRQHQKQPAKPQRHPKKPIQDRAPLTESPWNRATVHLNAKKAPSTTDSKPSAILPVKIIQAPPTCRKKFLYTIPDLMPQGTVSRVSTKRKRQNSTAKALLDQNKALDSKSHATTDGDTTSSNPPPSKRTQVNHPSHSGTTRFRPAIQPTTIERHGPGDSPDPLTTLTHPSASTRRESAHNNTQSQETGKNSSSTNDSNGLDLTASAPIPPQQLVEEPNTLLPCLTAVIVAKTEFADDSNDPNGSNLSTFTWNLSQQLVNTTKAPLPTPSPNSKAIAAISEKSNSEFGELLAASPVKRRRVATPTLSPTTQKDSPQIQTPETDISSTCPCSPGNLLNEKVDPMSQSTVYEQSTTFDVPSYQPDPISHPSYTLVTGGGSPLPRNKSPADLEHDIALSNITTDDHSQSSNSQGLSIVNDDESQHISPEMNEAVSQTVTVPAHTRPSRTVDETQESDPETPRKNLLPDDTFKSPEPSIIIMLSESSDTPSTPSPRTPGREQSEKETSPSDRSKGHIHFTETPDAKLAQLTLEDDFNPDTPTPKARPHSAEKGHRVTRAETKRLQLLEEIQHYGIVPLEKEWDYQIQTALKNGHGNYKSTDLIRVLPLSAGSGTDNWLNDEVINGYLKMIVAHGRQNDRPTQSPTHHAFVSFFYNNLEGKGYESVKRWASRAKIGGKNLLETEQVFIPINSGMHWTLCVVSGKNKTITHYNSLGGNGQRYVNTVQAWVKEELGSSFKESEWTLVANGESPQQTNMDDCGVFTITSARQIMLGMTPMSYNAGQIPLQRKRIVAELINGGLIKSNE
ncbi:uncharacterized protein A1O9_03133 [Exophiala aquamarina CBS 119918]|uniref:Ubiquitin-like protease family profile domain-containing protein n=1 Tax=Exophiala aquamarina CBS 119918 TaxID=1182545 RepID=A0A072Q0Y5_9EURO|nr:uncharacterized protein A1O9_03133 [Exophiala aquamarina CBS 119918]KEF61565.1 hypothetical protein A1O9_03133 [Exophiala aquamarina CBS 119918]